MHAHLCLDQVLQQPIHWFIVVEHEEELDKPGQLDCLEHLSDEPQLAEIDDEPEDGELGSVFVKSVPGTSGPGATASFICVHVSMAFYIHTCRNVTIYLYAL